MCKTSYILPAEYVNPLTIVPSSQDASIGNSTTFQCLYKDGSPDEVMWYKKDGSLPIGRHSVDKGLLTIMKVDSKDEGTYVCKVNTGGREVTVEAHLKVECE